VNFEARGLLPGSDVEAWLYSDPVYLGRRTVGADGSINTTFEMPAETQGSHTLRIEAKSATGALQSVDIPLDVGPLDAEETLEELPTTGVGLNAVAITASAMALAGGVIARRRRRWV
jgi:LPXTG-motif cell wall-anchored protein